MESKIFSVRTAANREDQVVDYIISKLQKGTDTGVYAVVKAHGMRGYIFLEAASKQDAEQLLGGVPYARGLLPAEIPYPEIEHMLEQVKIEMNIKKSDIVEIISGPFKRENAKVMRINKQKEEIVVELLEAAVPIPVTVKMDTVKVIRREDDESADE
jgi:transcription termination/antitermination protein NusG